MENIELTNQWLIGLAIVGAIVVIAAALLILIWLAAKRILKLAQGALDLVIEIKNNTNSIWELQETNRVAGNIKTETEKIEKHAGLVAEALEEVNSIKY